MRSKDSKAAKAQLKRAEGIHSSDEKKFAKKEGDVDDFTSQLFRKFVVNRMDSIAHCNVNAMETTTILGSTPKPANMLARSSIALTSKKKM